MDVVFIDWDEYGIYGCHVDVFGFPLVEFLPCFFGVVLAEVGIKCLYCNRKVEYSFCTVQLQKNSYTLPMHPAL